LGMASRVSGMLLLVFLFWADGEYGQQLIAITAASCLIVTRAAEASDRAIVGAKGMTCDGATDDTVEFQRAIDAARKSAKRLVLPSGTCLVTSTIYIPDHIWIQGRGKLATVIRRKSGVNLATDVPDLSGASGDVTITDLTVDGNKSGNAEWGQYSLGAAGVQASGVSKLTIQRTRWINAYQAAIGLLTRVNSLPIRSSRTAILKTTAQAQHTRPTSWAIPGTWPFGRRSGSRSFTTAPMVPAAILPVLEPTRILELAMSW
jgi:hypothetical protein